MARSWSFSSSPPPLSRSEEHTSELQSQSNLVCRLLLEKKHTVDYNPFFVSFGATFFAIITLQFASRVSALCLFMQQVPSHPRKLLPPVLSRLRTVRIPI